MTQGERDSDSDTNSSPERNPGTSHIDHVQGIELSHVPLGALASALRRKRERALAFSGKDGKPEVESPNKKRHSKAPLEMSSKVRPRLKRPAGMTTSQPYSRPRDPRFDPLCGTFNENAYRDSYSFLGPLTKGVDPKLEPQRYQSLRSKEEALERKAMVQEIRKEWKGRDQKLMEMGAKSKPYYLKKSEEKRLVLAKMAEKYPEKMSKKGLERSRKREAAKDRKTLFQSLSASQKRQGRQL